MSRKKGDSGRRRIVVRAFFATGKDGEEGLFGYIDQLERAIITMDKKLHDRRRRLGFADLDKILREHNG